MKIFIFFGGKIFIIFEKACFRNVEFVGSLFLLVSGKGCGLCLWQYLDFSLTFFFIY